MSDFLGRLKNWWNRSPLPSPVFDEDIDLSKTPEFALGDLKHGVQILNDPASTFDQVIDSIQSALGMTRKEAAELAVRIHTRGGTIVAMYSRLEASAKADSLLRVAASKGAALRVKVVPVDGA